MALLRYFLAAVALSSVLAAGFGHPFHTPWWGVEAVSWPIVWARGLLLGLVINLTASPPHQTGALNLWWRLCVIGVIAEVVAVARCRGFWEIWATSFEPAVLFCYSDECTAFFRQPAIILPTALASRLLGCLQSFLTKANVVEGAGWNEDSIYMKPGSQGSGHRQQSLRPVWRHGQVPE